MTWAPLAGLLVAAAVAGCSRPQPSPEPIRAVKTVTVANDSAAASYEFAGEVRARVETRLGFRVPGKLIARPAEVGQRVKAGQVLAQIDASDLRLGQEAAAAATRTAQVQYEQSAAEFKRFQELREQGFISTWELERRESALKTTRAQLEQAQAQADVQRNQAGYALLTASAPGVVTAVEAEVGTVLAAGASVLRLAHDGPRDVVFSVPEDGADALRALRGVPGAIRVRPWGTGGALPATVRELAAAADPVTRTFLVKADAGAAPLQLGQTVTAIVARPPRGGITKLPLSAVMQHRGQTSVWLVDPASMTVRLQPVTVGGAEGNAVIIASGLNPGQVVVSAGVHVLTPGQKVKFFPTPSMPTPAAPAAAPASAARR